VQPETMNRAEYDVRYPDFPLPRDTDEVTDPFLTTLATDESLLVHITPGGIHGGATNLVVVVAESIPRGSRVVVFGTLPRRCALAATMGPDPRPGSSKKLTASLAEHAEHDGATPH